MGKLFSTTTPGKNASIFLVFLFFLSTLAGCSQHKVYYKVNHPGKYELADLGEADDKSGLYRAFKVHDKIIFAHTSVIFPTFFSVHLLEHTEIHEGESVLDIGTGTGVQAMFGAEKASRVLAMDISKQALENTLVNARRFGVSDKVSVRESDLFNALKPDEKFDVIISSIPYAWNKKTQGNWKLHERFFQDVGKHLNPNGRIYFVTGWLKNLDRTKKLVDKNNLRIVRADMIFDKNLQREPIVYLIKHSLPVSNNVKTKTSLISSD